MFYFYTNKLNFSPSFMGEIRLLGSIASLVGVGTFNFFLKEVKLRTIFLWTALIGAGLGLSQLVLISGVVLHPMHDARWILGSCDQRAEHAEWRPAPLEHWFRAISRLWCIFYVDTCAL